MDINYLIGFFVFILGVCIGSFLNCVVYRLEKNKSINGRSFCPNCKHQLSWKELFPIFSFLILKGKCKHCKEKISWQYPVVEILTGLLFLLIFILKFSILNSIFLFYIVSSFVIIFVYDLKHYIIPDKILFPAIIITVLYDLSKLTYLGDYALAVLVSAGFFLLIFLISKGKWMGFGDVKFAVLMGLLLGFSKVLLALFLAFSFGAVIGLILMTFKGKNLKSEVPFGPFLILGTLIAMFYGETIIRWYLNLFQI